ncbi:MAG TPA: xanthine dehydrogenase family protein molybdopterin-binding subunit [Steroidobacteraceae bacterium]|nr:xanthine dehydrogenase family protein molybdopterin-binding subunit [Steroidobacteraceae bacterium]
MSARPADPSRREFCRSTAVLGGGLVLALTLPARASRSRPSAVRGPAELNAWLRIGSDDSITMLVDRSEMGQGVYTALPMLIAEELEVDLARVAIVAAPVGPAYVNPGNGGQVTGTSNSVQDGYEKLRIAGAQARHMLIAAAAARWHVDAGQCRADDGGVLGPKGRRLSYGQLAMDAARLTPPKDVKLKSRTEFRLVGTPHPRLDTPGKVDGSAQFGIDVRLPGMLYAVLAQCPTLGGKVSHVDSSAAAAVSGVRRILPTDGGIIIVAEHVWQAMSARRALKVEWDAGVHHALDTASIGALLEHGERTGHELTAKNTGDVAAALKREPHVLASVYELPLLAHATMEPMNCTADVKAGHCDLYVGTQVQQAAQQAAAEAAGLKPEQVNVITTLLGGGFGRRLEVDFIPAAVIASKAMGVPVQLLWSREDDMRHDIYRPPARESLAAALDAQGKLTALKLHIISPSATARAAPSTTDPFDSVIEYADKIPYAIPSYHLSYSRQEVGVDVGYMRSVSHAPNCFAIECFMDELSALARRDPIDFRLALLEGKPRHRQVLELAKRRSGWGLAKSGRFLGVALLEGYDSKVAQVAEISIAGGALKVHKITCVVDCGAVVNPRIVESQIESGIVFGLSAALWGEITLAEGQVRQGNFNDYRLLRLNEMPELDVHLVASAEAPGGIGEAAVPPVAPALCNAVFAATGKRIRRLPLAGQALA